MLTHYLLAGPVDINRAKAFASQFIEVEEEAFRSAQNTPSEEAPAYYVFKGKASRGFVIVSGEDRLPLLIGYADDGVIDQNNLPIQLRTLLEQYRRRVAELRKTPDTGGFRSQKVFMHKPRVIVEALTKSHWGQGKPFNDECPEIRDSKKAAVGCVATAIAQVMYYHKWPVKGQGSHSYTPPAYGSELTADFSQSTYQWAKMIDRYESRWSFSNGTFQLTPEYSVEEGSAVAKLMSDVGISVNMDYDTSENGGSGAITSYGATALKTYFDYTTRFLRRNQAMGNTFVEAIKSELDTQRPLILSGQGSGGGHAWVIDGYDENDYLHCNWGWEGLSDGFFSLNLMSPDALGTGGGAGGFNRGQGILIAVPNKAGVNTDGLIKENILVFGAGGGLDLDMFQGKDKTNLFLLQLNSYFNHSSEAFNSEVAVGIYNADNTFIDVIKTRSVQIPGTTPQGSYSGRSTYLYGRFSNYDEGTYLLRPLYKPNGANDWEIIDKANILTIEIKGDELELKDDTRKLRFKHTMSPREDVQAYTNTTGVSTIEVENLSSEYIECELGIKLVNLTTQQVYSKKLELVRLPALGKAVLHPKYKLSDLNLPAGDYALSFELYFVENIGGTPTEVAKTIENPFGAFQIKVLDANTLPKLICTGFSVEQGGEDLDTFHLTPEMIKKGDFKFSSSIQNKGTIAFSGKLTYRLKNLEDNSLINLGELENLNISAGQELAKSANFIELDIRSLNLADGTYRIELIAESNGTEINVWNASIEPYSFITKGLESLEKEIFKVTLAQVKEGGRLLFAQPINNEAFEQSFEVDTEVTLISQTSENYELKEVLLNGKNIYQVGKAIKFVLKKNSNVEPIYAKEMIALPALTADNGTLTYVGHQVGDKLAYGTEVELMATPSEGYGLATLTHNGVDIKNAKRFVLGKQNVIVASFAKEMIALPALTAKNGALTYVGHQAGDKLAYGTEVKLMATPSEGYELATLTHNGIDIKNTQRFVLGKQNVIVVSFAKQMIALPALTADNGTLIYVGHQVGDKLAYGTEVELRATPSEGYELATLTHNDIDIKSTQRFVLGKQNVIVVSFTKQMIALPALTAENGTLTYVGHQAGDKLAYGTEIKLRVTPSEGYELATFTHNGVDIKSTKRFVLGKQNVIVASFAKEMIALPALTAENGTLIYVGHQVGDKLAYGTEVELRATPSEGYELATLTHNDIDIKSIKRFVLGKQNVIVASFAKITALGELKKGDVQVFPNPARDYIKLKGFTPNEVVYLLTINGKRVLEGKVSSDGSARLNVSNLARGFYFIYSRTYTMKLELR